MDLEPDLAAVKDGRHVGGNDGVHPGCFGRIQGIPRRLQILPVEGDIEGHVGLDSVRAADTDDFRQVLPGEIVGRMGTHVQPSDPEIDGIGSALDGRHQAVETPRGSHDFQILFLHRP